MRILCNESTHLSNKPECQQKGLNWSISFIPGPFIGYQRPGDLLVRVLSWSLFSERSRRALGRQHKNSQQGKQEQQQKRGEDAGWGRGRGQPGGSLILDGLACQVFSSWPRHGWDPRWPCLSGIFFTTLSRAGPPIMAPSSLSLNFMCFLCKMRPAIPPATPRHPVFCKGVLYNKKGLYHL